jgi:mannose-1-phosphate guanylyltransferase
VRFALNYRTMQRRVDSLWTGVVLCAGLGTRLRPLTEQIPKPLVPILDRPLARFACDQLVAAGASRLSVNAFHLAPQVVTFARTLATELGIEVGCHVETELLGTAGAIVAMALGPQRIVVWNGDIFAPDLSLDWVEQTSSEEPILVVSPVREQGPGTVGLAVNGDVVRVRGQRFGVESRAADYIGVAYLPPSFVATLPSPGCLINDGILPWLHSGRRVRSKVFEGFWSDGGTLREYVRQNLHWLTRSGAPFFRGEDSRCGTAVVLVNTVVGRGAEVVGQGVVERTVVLPGARVCAPLRDVVVAPDGRVLNVWEDN